MSDPKPTARPTAMGPVEILRELGYVVEEQDMPGLYRINGGQEVTLGQLRHLAMEADFGRQI